MQSRQMFNLERGIYKNKVFHYRLSLALPYTLQPSVDETLLKFLFSVPQISGTLKMLNTNGGENRYGYRWETKACGSLLC